MHPDALRALLRDVAAGALGVDAALERLATLPYEDLEFAKVDHHRALRCGVPEVVFASGKTPDQIEEIVVRLHAAGSGVLVTRITAETAQRIVRRLPDAVFHSTARALTLRRRAGLADVRPSEPAPTPDGFVAIVSAGTSDLPVAEEARVTVEALGVATESFHDVGVAGLHRLLGVLGRLRQARVVVAVAGMEGALPSVVGGLVEAPVIAVPTSVGYGASFQGLAALLAMLNGCAAGVSVVNIDNGFGAGYQAAMIVRATTRTVPRAVSPSD